MERLAVSRVEQIPEPLREPIRYALAGGGKRLRPALVLLIAKMLGYEGERAVRYGAIVELIHTATLIHDTLIELMCRGVCKRFPDLQFVVAEFNAGYQNRLAAWSVHVDGHNPVVRCSPYSAR